MNEQESLLTQQVFLKREIDNGKVTQENLARYTGHEAGTIGKQYTTLTSEYAKEKKKEKNIYDKVSVKGRLNFGFIGAFKEGWKGALCFLKNLGVGDKPIPKNIKLCLDEVYLKGNVYTILSRPYYKKLLGFLYGTKSEKIVKKLKKLPKRFRNRVTEVAVDMSGTMEKIVKETFENALITTDRFHVRKNINDHMKDLKRRIKANLRKKQTTKKKRKRGRPKKGTSAFRGRPIKRYGNGETKMQIAQRMHYQILKNRKNWSKPEKRRRKLIKSLQEFKAIVTAYEVTEELYVIYEDKNMTKEKATKLFEEWIKRARKRSRLVELQRITNMLENRLDTITNYFISRHTNGYAEGQNQRIRKLVNDNRGFKKNDYMVFRCIKAFG